MTFEEAAALMIGGMGGSVKEIGITKNGEYSVTDEEIAEGYVGYNPIYVNVAPNLTTISISENGDYEPPSGFDGFSKVTVNVPSETAIIQALTVTEPGIYKASDYGCDGFDPVNVSDMYKKLYEQSIGNGEDVTDDNGNNIPNAVTSSNSDDFNEYLKHIEFGPYGGSVSSHGLDGDTEWKFEVEVRKHEYYQGIRYSTGVHLIIKNLITGQTNTQARTSYENGTFGAPPFKVKITGISFPGPQWVAIDYEMYRNDGSVLTSGYLRAAAPWVGGTYFRRTKDWASTVSQNAEPVVD